MYIRTLYYNTLQSILLIIKMKLKKATLNCLNWYIVVNKNNCSITQSFTFILDRSFSNITVENVVFLFILHHFIRKVSLESSHSSFIHREKYFPLIYILSEIALLKYIKQNSKFHLRKKYFISKILAKNAALVEKYFLARVKLTNETSSIPCNGACRQYTIGR